MFGRLFASLIMTIFLSGTSSASNLLFILDASGSMWGKVDDRFKIEIAKTALTELVGQLPADSRYGAMVYGHRYDREAPESCTDIQLVSPIAGAQRDMVRAWLSDINPKGQTPMAEALERSRDAFAGLEAENNNVVLISDGEETCDGDPCAAAASLVESGINVRVHVVGFDVGATEREQLECIARSGQGEYFSADSTEGFGTAVSEAIIVAQAETPEPEPAPAPEPERVFFDDFDGTALAEHWSVTNENTDAYLVEGGQLLLLSGKTTGFQVEGMENLVTLNQPLPEGDWDAVVQFGGEFRTGRDQFWLGLYEDSKNFLSADVSWSVRPSYNDYVYLRLSKHANGDPTQTMVEVHARDLGDAAWDEYLALTEEGVHTLVLSKRARSYSATYSNTNLKDEEGNVIVWTTDKLTSLRVPGQLTLGVSKWGDIDGEVLSLIDSVEILSVAD